MAVLARLVRVLRQRHSLLLLRLCPITLQVQDRLQRLVGQIILQVHVQGRVHQVLRGY